MSKARAPDRNHINGILTEKDLTNDDNIYLAMSIAMNQHSSRRLLENIYKDMEVISKIASRYPNPTEAFLSLDQGFRNYLEKEKNG